DLAGHRHAGKLGRIGHQVVTVDEEDRGEGEAVAGHTRELLDLDHVALGNLVLLAAGLDDCGHRTRTPCDLSSRKPLCGWWLGFPAGTVMLSGCPSSGCTQERDACKSAVGKNTSSPARDPNRRHSVGAGGPAQG